MQSKFFISAVLIFYPFTSFSQSDTLPVFPDGYSVTPADEQIGRSVTAKLTSRWKLTYDHPRMAELNSVIQRLTAAGGVGRDPWQVYVFEGPRELAGAAPGSHVFIWTGLIDAAANEAELALVLAHEIAHVVLRHIDPPAHVSRAAGSDPASAISEIVRAVQADDAAEVLSILTRAAISSAQLESHPKASPEQELEADAAALMLVAEAGYDPESALRLWERRPDLEFLKTKLALDRRLTALRFRLPQATQRYRAAQGSKSEIANDQQF